MNTASLGERRGSRLASRVSAWGAEPLTSAVPLSRGERLALVTGFVLLVVMRLPRAWLHGRFLDEEGTIFFAYAWHRSVGDALLRSFAGYLNIGANATALLTARLVRAGVLPLEVAPYLTMTLALVVQTLPAVLIVTGRARWLANRWAIVASLLVIAIGPMTEEVFANVLHIQFHLALCAALILALAVPRARAAQLGYSAILFLAPLCGPGAIVFLPLFALRSAIDRDLGRIVQTTVFAAGAALQLLLFFGGSPVRGQILDPATLAAILFVRLLVMPLFTSFAANFLGRVIYRSQVAGAWGLWIAAFVCIAYLGVLIALALRNRRDEAIWLIGAAVAIGVVSFGGGMIVGDPRDWFSVGAGERYNFLPLALLSLGLIALAVRPGRHRIRLIVLCGLTLISGVITYPIPIPEVSSGPRWPTEVAAWRRDHDHPLASWPANWTVDLSDRDRRCSPPRPGALASTDPSYCESAWLARVTLAVAKRKAT